MMFNRQNDGDRTDKWKSIISEIGLMLSNILEIRIV